MPYKILNTLATHARGGFNLWDVLLDALADSAKMLPFLFLAFLLMEFIEHRAGEKLTAFLRKNGGGRVGGAALGAVLGCVPQCGFSVAASNLYAGRVITVGTLIAVFLSTSDEAVPVLLAHPDQVGMIWKLIAAKIIIAAAVGIIADIIVKIFKLQRDDETIEDICTESGCGCGSHGIWYSSLKHTVNIFIFILIVNLILGTVMALVGEETVETFLGKMGIFQPILAGILGMIPNCAASVLITELYAEGAITFGSAVAGLCTGAGVGLAVLFRANKNLRENLIITAVVFAAGVLSGTVLNLF
ncbi:MAG: arsenic efflux protein [Ruminococcus sp.]|nr:arsenic efflux protein [Ruminococcus sp.]MCM1380682.1 arsenic efflux protein [Muribaculaceae bacterium]MCM1479847.1 arsenic efflux protein [Muribaculaceae bacterium]